MARPAIQAAAMVISLSDTQDSMVTVQGEQVGPPRRRNRWWAVPIASLGLLALFAVIVAGIAPSSLFATKRDCATRDAKDPTVCAAFGPREAIRIGLVPADAQPVEPRLAITGRQRFPSTGQLLFVTIREPSLTLVEWLVGSRNGAVQFFSYNDIYGNETPSQQSKRSARSMSSAKDIAEYVAFSKLGFDATLVPGEVIIDQITCVAANADNTQCVTFAPAGDVLQADDQLQKVDGVTINTVEDLTTALSNHKSGDKVSVDYVRAGATKTGDVELTVDPGNPNRTIVGFVPIDTTSVKLPSDVKVKIGTAGIGGPSAGLAFTLTLIDELSTGDLTGGKTVAVTGEIRINGDVGAIGGLTSKASAVLQTGAKYFLVPTSQGEADIAAARKVVANKVQIIPVANVDEALAALAKIGGDPFVGPSK